jgi:hypothetical protein
MCYEQLSLNFPEDSTNSYIVEVLVNGTVVSSQDGGTYEDALLKRSSVVSTGFPWVIWEDTPRPTGWFGHTSVSPGVSDYYTISLKKVSVNTQ